MDDLSAIHERCDALASGILACCEAKNLKIAAAESLTAGLLSDAFVRIPGASHVFLGSAVTYDIRAKASILGVDRALLEREGAVHPEVARQMAFGAARLYAQPQYEGCVIGLSTTGVAGPGPDGDKPAGLVYVGLRMPADTRLVAVDDDETQAIAYELRLHGSREEVRLRTVMQVLVHLDGILAE